MKIHNHFSSFTHQSFVLCCMIGDIDGIIAQNSCPCLREQATADFGRFVPLQDCDEEGDSFCYYQQGASHCVISSRSAFVPLHSLSLVDMVTMCEHVSMHVCSWTGSAQVCCYGAKGFLQFSDDFEYSSDYLRFLTAGVPFRAHPWGALRAACTRLCPVIDASMGSQ